jgi:hypothetical protein
MQILNLPQISSGENGATSHIFPIEQKQFLNIKANCQIHQRWAEMVCLKMKQTLHYKSEE